ncbi:MAG: hypothetical protein EXS69_02210 [Candidatus Zambryskibacteria bacterium]|nr:hypothetical protein [Candidatus Zambryskibacteria bacterium]
MKKGSIFVAFHSGWSKELASRYDEIVTPERLRGLIKAGSVEEASELNRKLSLITDRAGRRVSKIVNFKGFELWWINYDNLMYKFSLPYTEYRSLLEYLKDFSNIYLYKPPHLDIFKYFLDAHECRYVIKLEKQFSKKFPIGVLFQVALSIPFLFWLKLRNPKLLVWTSDRFDPPRDHNFRMKFIYEELKARKINFMEFIRSMEPSPIVFEHCLKRRRPVIYSYAIVTLARALRSLFESQRNLETFSRPKVGASPEEIFWHKIATHYAKNFRSDIWAIKTIKFILKFIGIKSAIIIGAINRNFPEVLACKLSGIPTVGIQHGLHPKYYFVSDFMHEFDGDKTLSVDKYGLWSEWWKEYYLKYSKAYKPEQLYVSGLMRPLEKIPNSKSQTLNHGQLKVLFVAEELAAPEEVLPYLEALLEDKNVSVYIKFRPYKDGFEAWLKENHPEIIKNFDAEKILKISMHEAIALSDVVVGSHSAGVFEAALQLKPFVLFRTEKWGDFLGLISLNLGDIVAGTPEEFIAKVKRSKSIPQDGLKKIQELFFGNPYQNGSRWVVDQAEEALKGCFTK